MTDFPEKPPVALALEQANIPHRVFVHPGPVRSLEQAAEERGQKPEQVVRSILFRLESDKFMLVLVAGPRQISWKALRSHTNQSRLTMASPEQVLAATGYPIGAVGPFGLQQTIPILVDQSVLAEEELSIGSGVRGTTIFIRTDDLMNALGDVETVDFLKK